MEPSSEAVCKAGNINHVAIIVRDIEETLKFYQETFGLGDAPIEEIPDQGVRAALLPIGGTHLELIQPVQPDTGVARFLEARGEAFHHICFEVSDLQGKLDSLDAKGYRLIDKAPRKGLAGMIAFIHPKSTRGVLIELVDKPKPE
jgi:methylmalonyl-CoA/ethylmalonyl-CoA epimerase